MQLIGWFKSIQLQAKCSVLWLKLEDKSCGLSCHLFCGLFRMECPVDKAQIQGEWSGSHQCPTGLTSYLASLSTVVFTSFFPWNLTLFSLSSHNFTVLKRSYASVWVIRLMKWRILKPSKFLLWKSNSVPGLLC